MMSSCTVKSREVFDGKLSETQQIRMICLYTVKKVRLLYINFLILVQYRITVVSYLIIVHTLLSLVIPLLLKYVVN